MINTEELEPIDAKEAREALTLLLSEGKSLWRTHQDDYGTLLHWLGLSFTSLEPLPEYQEQLRHLCGNRRRPADQKLSAAIHVLGNALKKMEEDPVNLEDPSISYRRLIMSIPD